LAVAAVEIGRVAAGIIAGLRRIVLGHLLLRGGTLRNSCCFALGAFRAPSKWRASAAEMRNKSCRIVTFQTERKRKLVPRPHPAFTSSDTPIRSAGRPSRVADMVNVKLRSCARSAPCDAGRTISARREAIGRRAGSKLRHSCNRFQRLPNWALIGLELQGPFRYLLGAGGFRRTDRGARRRA
jgi:hypothetical protein